MQEGPPMRPFFFASSAARLWLAKRVTAAVAGNAAFVRQADKAESTRSTACIGVVANVANVANVAMSRDAIRARNLVL